MRNRDVVFYYKEIGKISLDYNSDFCRFSRVCNLPPSLWQQFSHKRNYQLTVTKMIHIKSTSILHCQTTEPTLFSRYKNFKLTVEQSLFNFILSA
jgi:hypothetical protein